MTAYRDVQAKLAAALREAWVRGAPFVVDEAEGSATYMSFDLYAAALLPVVREYADQRAAEELREAADDWDANTTHVCDAPTELRARADALSARSPFSQPPGDHVDPPAVTRGHSGHTAGQGAAG